MGIASTNNTLNPIRPDNGKVDDNVPPEDVESLHGQEEISEVENEVKADDDRAEVEEKVRIPKPAAKTYTLTRVEVDEHEVTHLPYRS